MVNPNELRSAASHIECNYGYRLRFVADLMRESADELERLQRREALIPPDGVIADIRRRLNTTGGDASDV